MRAGRRPNTATVYRWELRKLISQKRTYLGLAFVIVMPVLFVVALSVRNGSPEGVAFGRYVHQSGLAVPLVLLIFGSIWLFPLVTALVAGDIVAAEDHNGTLKTILTRSVDRGRIFAAKAMVAGTYAFVALLVMGIVAVIAGGLEAGLHPLTTLSGTKVSVGHGLALMAAALGVYMMPMLAVASIGLLLSTVTRNSAGSVVGTLLISLLLQLVTILPGLGGLKPYLLPEQFNAWQGLLRVPADWAPIGHAAWVCALYAVPCLVAAYLVFLRRDVAGG
ncbi:MAG TPA: ABC transporter permease [Solirubrobacteraceae bacterium]|jgi:ABC-2 type transport system permease protein|nr:ABC transporter permease [Solirubrobacteraceae bacterium]